MSQSYLFFIHSSRNETFTFAVTFPKPTEVQPVGPWDNPETVEHRIMDAAEAVVVDAYGPGEWVHLKPTSLAPMTVSLPFEGGSAEFDLLLLARQRTS